MVRNKQALFWSFMFPLMFTVIFGFFFSGDKTSVGKVAIFNQSQSELAKQFENTIADAKIFDKQDFNKIEDAISSLRKNEVAAVFEVPAGFGDPQPDSPKQIIVHYDPANISTSTIVLNFTDSFLTQASFNLQHAQKIFSVKEEKTSTNNFNYYDFILIGMLGMALMNSSVQGIAINISKYREDQILKRLTTTPLKTWEFILAEVFSRLILNSVQVSLILVIGVFGFHGHIFGSIALIYLISLVGALLFQSMGFAIASLSATTSAAEGMATAITIPMMFLGGVFFPIDQLPAWLYSIVKFLPLSPLLKILRQVGLENTSLFTDPVNIIVILAWVCVMLVLSLWRFRLSDG